MIKFKHKKHMQQSGDNGKIVIYYNVSDIFLGTALMILVIFFINDYLSHALPSEHTGTSYIYSNKFLPGNIQVPAPTKR